MVYQPALAKGNKRSNMLGEGIIKGMAETARNFLGSYVSDERLTTIQYLEER